MQINNQSSYWARLRGAYFITALFVICMHNSSFANYSNDTALSSAAVVAYDTLKRSVMQIAVPFFFLMAGFNYFRNYDASKWKRKTANRVKSLLIPYFFWNTTYCVFCAVTSNTWVSRFFIGREKFTISLQNVLSGCLYHLKCNSHFWFVFVLMLLSVINIGMYHVIRKRTIALGFLILTALAVYVFRVHVPEELIYRLDAFLYYYLGAYLALHHATIFDQDITISQKLKCKGSLINCMVGVMMLAATLILLIPGLPYIIEPFIILTGCAGLWEISMAWKNHKGTLLTAGGTTFLMYAFHGIIQPISVKLLYLLLPKYDSFALINFVLAAASTAAICTLIRMFMRRFVPNVDHVMTGWRQ